MSVFKRVLASVGIGAAQVDTRLEEDRVRAGEEVRGVVHLRGGQVEQQVDRIYLYLMTEYLREVNDRRVRENVQIARFQATDPFTLPPGEERSVPFSFVLPEQTPVSTRHTPVWLKTGLDVPMALDPSDHDHLHVLPHAHVQVVLDALDLLGFRLRKAETEYSRRLGRGMPFVQEFEFVPTSHFRSSLQELELIFYPDAHGVEVIMEVDRRARGLMGFLEEALDMDERLLRGRFSAQELAAGPRAVAEALASIIERHGG